MHAIVGENGAGKSTLGKIVAGVLAADGGRMLLAGTPVSFGSPKEALEHGVAIIAQEPSVVATLSVAENVLLGREPRRLGFVRRRALRRRYEQLAEAPASTCRARLPAGRLRVAEQQQVEIMRALARDARVIVMDEPSAALDGADTEHLHEVVRSLAAAGTTILLISHFLREVLELTDAVTVLRDGQRRPDDAHVRDDREVARRGHARPTPDRRVPAQAAACRPMPRSRSRFAGCRGRGVSDATLDIRRGEIVALAGLVGAGRTELARAIFGADTITAGEVADRVGRRLRRGTRQSLRDGIAMIPESRKDQGLLFTRSVRENVTLARLDRAQPLARRAAPCRAAGGEPHARALRRARSEPGDARRRPVRRQPAEGAASRACSCASRA